ncbi:MAG TPA: hypothetical protein VF043_28230 [Ktedonobacteraceae bacterium]
MKKYEEEDFVNIPVPKSRVEEVFRLLSTPKANVVSSPAVLNSGDSEWWTMDRIAKLKGAISNPTVIALLNMTAERADEWVGFDEIWRTRGITAGKARGDLAGLTRIIKRTFQDNEKGWWPVEIRDATVPIAYRMPVEIERRWKEA